jgi:cysteine desulfurase/selenocysteine lyase
MTALAIDSIRQAFPILTMQVHRHPLTYLDNAATTQKPTVVIDAISNYYNTMNANIHRGAYFLSEQATEHYETARKKVQRFINAKSERECIFVQGTTKAINLVANSFGEKYIHSGDEILISAMEHHANIVPWQLLCTRKQAILKVIPLLPNGELDLTNLDTLLTNKTKLVSIVYASNSLGTINPIQEIIQKSHALGIPVLIDAAQAIAHMPIDVQDLDCDFLAFSGHKMYGPMGIGVLYGKEKWLQNMPPYEGGGDMILQVTFEKTTYNEIPTKFEPGTMPIPEAIALGATIDFLTALDLPTFWQHEENLRQYTEEKLTMLPGIKIIGTAKNKIGIVAFTLAGVHPHDISTILDQSGIAVRAGHHCTMPVMDFFQVSATTRLSLAIYNTKEEIDAFIDALVKVKQIFKQQ